MKQGGGEGGEELWREGRRGEGLEEGEGEVEGVEGSGGENLEGSGEERLNGSRGEEGETFEKT